MAKPRRLSAEREARRPWWIFTALIAFIVVDVLLVVLALQSTAPRPSGPSSPRPSASSEQPQPSAPPTGTSDEAGTASDIVAVAPTRLLSALDDEVAWRATTGGCPEASAAPQLTTDGGDSWKSTDITRSTDVRALQRIIVSSAETASFIGATGDDCAPEFVRTFVAGDDFAENPDQLEGAWFLSPVSAATIHSPDGDVDSPCPEALVVAPLDVSSAGVFCDDNTIHVTIDAGATWEQLSDAGNVIAFTDAENGFLVAIANTADCEGARLALLDLDGVRTDAGCIESPLTPSELAAAIAIDWNDEAIWAWVDDQLLISTDGGNTW